MARNPIQYGGKACVQSANYINPKWRQCIESIKEKHISEFLFHTPTNSHMCTSKTSVYNTNIN